MAASCSQFCHKRSHTKFWSDLVLLAIGEQLDSEDQVGILSLVFDM